MKKTAFPDKRTIVPVVIALVTGLGIGALLFRGDGGSGEGGPSAEAVKEEVWTCSMHPQVRAPKPGLCPICAMDLIPLSAMGPAGGERDYTMSEAARKLAGITTVPVVRQLPEAQVRLYGKVVYDQSRIEAVSARFDGRLDKLFVNYTGVRVIKDEHLAMVYSPDLLTAQSELLTAKKFGNSGATRLARDKLRLWGFSPSAIREIESTGKVLDQLTITAPVDGIVTHLNVNEGDYVKTGTRFFEIADLSQVWVKLQAYESDLPWLRYGQKVSFTVESFPGKTFEGTISFIPPDLDPATRTVSVRVNVPNPEELLKPGMFVRGMVTTSISDSGKAVDPALSGKWISPMHPEVVKDGPGKCDVCGMDLVPAEQLGYIDPASSDYEKPLLVPAGAVLHTGKRSIVYVEVPDKEEPTFEGRDILLGPRAGDFYIVEAGMKEGERVVAEGGFVIDSALQIQAKTSMMLPGEETPLYRKIRVPDSFLTGIDNVLQSYYNIQSGLAADKLKPAKDSGKKGIDAVAKIDQTGASPGAVEEWEKLAGQITTSFSKIEKADDIAAARVEFKNLTALTNETVRRFGTAYLPVHEMHCPMAFNDTGASWFQPDKNLLNPYFGAEMLHCGTVEETLTAGGSFPLSDESTKQIEKIVNAYLEMAGALADDDNPKAGAQAAEMKKLVAGFTRENLSGPLAPGMWMTLAGSFTSELENMTGQDSMALNRVYFSKVTSIVKAMIQQFGGGISFPVFEAHCPMAFNDEGADWLTGSEEINNPYFGAKMLKCGEITATIHDPAK